MTKKLIICILIVTGFKMIPQRKIRSWADTVGFSHLSWQTDSIIKRISSLQSKELKEKTPPKENWKTVICPHDDYTYTGYLYPLALADLDAPTVLLFGVAHKAKQFKMENAIVFDSFSEWYAPYGNIKVSPLREEIMKELPKEMYVVNDSLQKAEHSVEAILPFLQHYNKKINIVSVLVPYMSFARMDSLSQILATAISNALKRKNLLWGKDIAIVISNDAVHYGDTDWNGRNFARYGADSAGYKMAVDFEHQLISETLEGNLSPAKIKEFNSNTVSEKDFHEYKWTWCGLYSVPFGLLTSFYLNEKYKAQPLNGKLIDYSDSLQNKHIPVSDLRMGITAPANIRHWVGYAVIKYK